MKTSIKTTIVLALAVWLGTVIAPPVQAADAKKGAKVMETKAEKGRGAPQAKDDNIKTPRPLNDPAKQVKAPAAKGGEKERGVVSTLRVDNRTGLYIDIYLDGDFIGTVGPWGDGYSTVITGSHRLYARADFLDGSYRYWGPSDVVISGTYTWRLYP